MRDRRGRGMMLAALAGVCIATACTGASRALVSMHPPFVMAFGIGCLALAFARRRCDARLLAACAAGLCLGAMVPGSLPVGAVIAHVSGLPASSDLFALLDALDAHPQDVLGRRVRASGTWTPARDPAPASVSRRVMACCAADAIDVGLDVRPERAVTLDAASGVCVAGVLASRMRGGELRYEIVRATVRASRCSAR